MKYTLILLFIAYFVLPYLFAKYIGSKREIGYTKSVRQCILFSPIIGLIIILSSPKIKNEN